MEVTRATRHPPRVLFDREDTQFTPWLEENVEYLTDALDLSLTTVEREKKTPTGLSIDLIVDEEDTKRSGVIECQIEESDHDHLGKLLTYLSTFDAEIAIWIVKEPRYEHKKTIEWLNESTEKAFYLVKVEVVELDEAMAPLFTPLSGPSPEAREVGKTKEELSARKREIQQFWEELFDRTPSEFDLFSNISPKPRGVLTKTGERTGVKYFYRIRNDWADTGIYIDTRDADLNDEIFDTLYEQRDAIEAELPFEMEWQALEDNKACRIRTEVAARGLSSDESWAAIQNDMITAMRQIHSAFGSRIAALDV